MEALLAGPPPPRTDGPRTGVQRRKTMNRLPQPVWLYDRTSRAITGACILQLCERRAGSGVVTWQALRAVPLATVFQVQQEMAQWRGLVFRLFLDVELRLRACDTILGGPVALQFPEFLETSWRVFSLPATCTQPCSDPATSFQITTDATLARQFGVDPDDVDHLTPLPVIAVEDFEETPDVAMGDAPEGHAEAVAPDQAASSTRTPSDRLKGLFTPLPHGRVTHRYKPSGILHCLNLARHLKPSARLADVLSSAGSLLLDETDSRQLTDDLRDRTFHLPSIDLLRSARIRLDVLAVIFEQRHFLRQDEIFFLLVDSSPQMGVDFLCVIEDRFLVPSPHTVTAWLEVDLKLQDGCASQTDMLSTLGGGRAGLAKKTLNVANGQLMKCANEDAFHIRRSKHRGVLSDQGTERGINDVPISIIQRFANYAQPGSPDSFLWPRGLGQPGTLHMLYDALELACKRSPFYSAFQDDIRTVISFLTDRMLVAKYKATCLQPHEQDAFHGQALTHVDWKWEFLSRCLDETLPKMASMRAKFDLNKMLSSDSGSPLGSNVVKQFDVVLKSETFEPAAEMFLMVGHIVEQTAQDLETCDCHREVWTQGLKRKRRIALMREKIGVNSCCMMGRRLPWLIAKGKTELLRKLRVATSTPLQTLLAKLAPAKRVTVVAALEGLRLDLIEIITEKSGYMDHAPYVALGAFYSVYDDDLVAAKRHLRTCIDECDAAVAEGKQKLLHRESTRLFLPGSAVRPEVDTFLAGELPLHSYPRLFLALLEHALMPVVERRIEAVHATIKAFGRTAIGAGVPCVCAAIRCNRNLDLLMASTAFMEYACAQWRSRSLWDQALRLRYTQAELQNKKVADKILMIYQTGIGQEFEDTTESRARLKLWQIATSDTRMAKPRPPESVWQTTVFLKSILDRGAPVSIPRDLFDACRLPPEQLPAIPAAFRPATVAVDTALGEVPEIEFNHETSAIFQVINNAPETRVLCETPHVAEDRRFHVSVQLWTIVDPDPTRPRQIIAQIDTRSSITALDIRPLVLNIRRTLLEGARWAVRKSAALPSVRLLPEQLHNYRASILPIADEMPPHSNAIVPLHHSFGLVDMEEQAVVLKVLVDRGAFLNIGVHISGDIEQLADVSDLTIRGMVERGVLVAKEHAPSGITSLALMPGAIDWTLTHGLEHPVPLARSTTGREPLRKTKLELVLALQSDGWATDTGHLVPTSPQGRRVFNLTWSKPLSYFACLADADRVFGKGVPEVKHNGTSNYYKCLLLLDGERLESVLLALEDMNDELFRLALKDIDDGIDDGDRDGGDLQLLGGGGAIPIMPPMMREPGPGDEWVRVNATAHGFPAQKIYFDHSSPGRQKGYSVCADCGVCRWKMCHGTIHEYASTVLAWARGCHQCGRMAQTHREWTPPQDHVLDARNSLVLAEF